MIGYSQRVGARIRRARLARGLSQTQLADLIDVSPAYVSHWERGRHVPSPRSLEALERALGVPAEHLLWGAPGERLDLPPDSD